MELLMIWDTPAGDRLSNAYDVTIQVIVLHIQKIR